MSSTALIAICLAFLIISLSTNLHAQEKADSSYIKNFERNNSVEVYPGVYSTAFSFHNPLRRNNNFKLVANSSAYTGVYLNYKWASVMYSWAIPGTWLDKNHILKATNIQFRFNTPHFSFHPFYESYNGLLFQAQRRRKKFEPFRDITFKSAGINLSYYFNAKTFSHRAGNSFSVNQLKSKGSFFLIATPQWHQIKWNRPSSRFTIDSTTHHLLASNPSWISLTAKAGYQHNFVFKNGLFLISPSIAGGGGLLKEINPKTTDVRSTWGFQGRINAGYNGPLMYAYLTATSNFTHSNLSIRQVNKSGTDICLTLGYRFGDYSKKLFGIL